MVERTPKRPVQERLSEAAFTLFEERGYDATTVDAIAERAGVGRTTFFRAFPTKEDVIFPDHGDLLARVRDRLAMASRDTLMLAVTEAARLVLLRYLDEGDLARSRYRLTSSVPALRERELISRQLYQQVFRDALRRWSPGDRGGELRADLLAAAVVTAHNHVLRRWLRGLTDEPEAEFDLAMTDVVALFADRPEQGGTSVVVLSSTSDVDTTVARVRAALTAVGGAT
ncbi:TetR/AcrR family transcriptional regulator [Nocardioides sp.]|uniref:TetR/AcrR family transcriptional regulator n=1 Tax=Nocardioides sp. TaxID=35761 RepID=UPI003D0E1ABE